MRKEILRGTISGFFIFLTFLFLPKVIQAADPQEPRVNYIFRDSFYVPPPIKLRYDIYETNGFLLVRDRKRGFGSEFSAVTNFRNVSND